MVRIWYRDNDETDPRLEHHLDPPHYITPEELYKKTSVVLCTIDLKDYLNNETVNRLRREHDFTYEDEVTVSKEGLPDYEKNLVRFFREHLHKFDEGRLILEGSGYFDVRDPDEKWIRIEIVEGDIIILPSGLYQRFTLDTKNFIRSHRFFHGEEGRLDFFRPSDDMDCRKEYLKRQAVGFTRPQQQVA